MTAIIVLGIRIFMAVALYAFLGWVIVILWRDLQRQSKTVGKRKIPALRLTWFAAHQEQVRQYSDPEVIIGRDPASECHLEDETISARHARLSYHHNQWWLEDLNSTNGTFLNLERLDVPAVIVPGDELRCGQVNIQVDIREQ